jgi:DNA repair exonuclease SbcCD ATPase subunit
MAEIIGIVSGLVSLSEAGYRISKVLYGFGKSVFKAREQINELARELDSISSAFECLADVLKTSEGLLKPTLLDTTQAILDDCERTYTEIEENVHTVERQSLKAKERAQWPFRKAKVKQLRTRLESAKATLSLMVNILNLSAGIKFLRCVALFTAMIIGLR